MKKYYLLLSVLLFSLSVMAQKLEVVSFEAALTDNTAWNPSTCHKLDDGRYCPVVKVEFNAPSCAFEGGVIEGKTPLFKTNEYWVYMLPGARHIVIKHPDYEKLDVFFDEVNADIVRLKEKVTYILKLKGEVKKGLESVEKGEAAAMLKMAQNFEQGTGAYNKDLNQALIWYEKAAEAGSEEAQDYLADVLYNGTKGFSRDLDKALKWNEASAMRGNEKFIKHTAKLYEKKKQNLKAAYWLIKQNELHPDKNLQMYIAQLYPDNSQEKNKWLKIAADNGHADAAYEVASRLMKINSDKAADYYKKAIAAGNVKATTEYGRILLNGENGVNPNVEEGRGLLKNAIILGDHLAQSYLDVYELHLKQEAQLATYPDKIPMLTDEVIRGNLDALYTLYLIYSAFDNQEMAKKMCVALQYNCNFVKLENEADSLLRSRASLKGAHPLVYFSLNSEEFLKIKEAIESVMSQKLISVNSLRYIKSWALLYDEDCMNFVANTDMTEDFTEITTQYQLRRARGILKDYKSESKPDQETLKSIQYFEEMIQSAHITDSDRVFTPWLRQLMENGLIWKPEVVEIAIERENVRKEKEAKSAEQRRIEEAKRKRQVFVDEIKARGRKMGMTTFEVNGVAFNMVFIKGGRIGYSGNFCSHDFFIMEAPVSKALWNAVMDMEESNEYSVYKRGDYLNFLAKKKYYGNIWKNAKYDKQSDDITPSELEDFIRRLSTITKKKFRIISYKETSLVEARKPTSIIYKSGCGDYIKEKFEGRTVIRLVY
jgi:TPR repeat protein